MFQQINRTVAEYGISLDANNFLRCSEKAHRFIEHWDSNFSEITGSGKGYIHPTSTIHEMAVIGDEVFIGENVRVGPFCFLRSKTILFPNVILGYGVELDRIILFDGVKISHVTNFGRSIIGNRSNFGYGNVIATKRLEGQVRAQYAEKDSFLSKARHHGGVIGADVVTGVNVSFMPGTSVVPGSRILPCTLIKGFHE